MRYRRARIKGGTYFFTLNTFKKERILTEPENTNLLRAAFKHVMEKHPFKIDAIVILPEHMHCVWTLPKEGHDYSKRLRLIKTYFSKKCEPKYKLAPYKSRKLKKEQAI